MIDGYELEAPIGAGLGGDLWRARDVRTGELVTMQRLAINRAVDPVAIRELAARTLGVGGAHVARLRVALPTQAGLVLVFDLAAGGSLQDLTARRGRLTGGEIVTIGVPLARVLAELHDRGLVHGAISARTILIAGDGRPLLLDPAVAAAVASPPGGSPGGDVRALATALLAALGRGAPRELVSVLDVRRAGRPGVPTAASMATALSGVCAPVAVGLTAPASNRRRARPRGRLRERHRAVRVVLALAVVAAAGVGGTAWGRVGSRASTTAPTAAPASAPPTPRASPRPVGTPAPSTDWDALLHRLDQRREAAFARADPTMLSSVYAAGSEALAIDRRAVLALVDGRLRVQGLHLTVVGVRPLVVTSRTAVLRVSDTLSAYDVVDASGHRVAHHRGRALRAWSVWLAYERGEWLVRRIAAT